MHKTKHLHTTTRYRQFTKLNQMETTENTKKLLNFISQKFEGDELDNDSLVQIIELCGMYLNIQTISSYAKANNLSYNGAKNFRNVKTIFGGKFIIDNF